MEGRRRITLYDQMTAGKTTSLADLILHDSVTAVSAAAADTTAATADSESCELSQSRTLVDILREDKHNNITTADRKSRKSFSFMDKLRFKLVLNSRSNYSNENNSSNNDNNNNNSSSSNNHIDTNLSELQARIDPDELTQQDATTHRQQNDAIATAAAADTEIPAEVAVVGPVGVSLMDLLEETDMETGFEVSSYRMSNADFEDVIECVEEKCEEEGASIVERNCCVCMVRHRGAAFIPCGHTFCRLCSREVWVNRGNCPLCNNFILEILDIF
ncbi:uncharacterized protein LOC130961689 [Arachis stenosperma]|uniref:uncharacterized protein LOC130961689 n=1 Tax=Arachis stenosperma TaxID=217475 RepID=UPI0025AC2721|nr:uncharacterized protein LOC130961689 [Arachis stenosperma]